jgi:polyisoprenoid-binding protein YceI
MTTKWTVNTNQSDVLIKNRKAVISFLPGSVNRFEGYVDVQDDEVENASVSFSMNASVSDSTYPMISFESISYQKVNKDINFLKGNLTIENITRVVELDAEFIGINNCNGSKRAAFEMRGDINRKDFGLSAKAFQQYKGLKMGQNIQFIANLEFNV